jgi:hypothetical protein
LENLLRWREEKLFPFPTPVGKWHQSLTAFNERTSQRVEVHFHYLFFHKPSEGMRSWSRERKKLQLVKSYDEKASELFAFTMAE